MLIIDSYKDLLTEIEILEWLHGNLVRELQRNKREVWGHTQPLPKALATYDNIIERMKNIEEELEIKRALKAKINVRFLDLTGLEHVVAYMRDIQGKSLQEIADDTKCSYSYISKISSRLNSAKRVKDGLAK